MANLNAGPGLYASLNNINPPSDLSEFEPFLDAGLQRYCAFVFVPNSTLPTTMDWYTTVNGSQPQGLDTNGTGTTESWAAFFKMFADQGVQVGFTFGGEGGTNGLGPMLEGLNNSTSGFSQFVATLQSYNVSFIHFDIEGSWATPPGFIDQFQQFAQTLTLVSKGTIAIEVGASAPIGTVDNSPSQAPAYLTPAFVQQNSIFFNVYTYYTLEVDNVVSSNTPWIPCDTDIPASNILFSVTCNNTTPAPSGQMDFTDFMNEFPSSELLSTVKNEGYLGFDTWVWWQTPIYPQSNCLALFQQSAT